ncbi:cytochrome P450 [Xylariaceae sp. FL1019]|nr:cytochrome P450 [Xylariaceae sp. FL1019]
MEDQAPRSVQGTASPMMIIPLFLFLCALTVPGVLRGRSPLAKVHLWGRHLAAKERQDALLRDSKLIYLECYRQFKNSLGFRVTTVEDSGEKLIVSAKYLEELKKLPPTVLSFEQAHNESTEKRYTNSAPPGFFRVVPHIIRADLTPALTRLNQAMTEKVDEIVLRELGECTEWTPMNVYGKILRVIAVASGRVFIGPELCQDERYIDAAVNYTLELAKAIEEIKSMNRWLKPFMASRLGSIATVRRRENDFLNFISPTVEARSSAMAIGQSVPEDMLTWLMEKGASAGIESVKDLSLIQLGLTHVASHSTGATATNILYDLASRPECIQPLRDEIKETLDEFDGVLTSAALQRLRKMDSLMKESLRVHPLLFSTFERRALQPFTLSDGHVIPQGTIIEIPNHAISRDPELYPDPDSFEPWRFYDMSQRPDGADKRASSLHHQFVSVSNELGSFGYGRHACPGRFFAANELKMILARILLAYDMRMKDGETERYPNLEFGLTCVPDSSRELLFRRVVSP